MYSLQVLKMKCTLFASAMQFAIDGSGLLDSSLVLLKALSWRCADG